LVLKMDWVNYFEVFFQQSYQPRTFKAVFGVSPDICSWAWRFLEEDNGRKPTHLLWALNFLKTGDTYANLATRFRVTERTIQTRLWQVIEALYEAMDEVPFLIKKLNHPCICLSFLLIKKTMASNQIDPSSRFSAGQSRLFPLAFVALDVTVCPIQRPLDREEQKAYFSGKHKDHVQKWECAVGINDGVFYWVSRAFPGPVHDSRIFHEAGFSSFLLPGEEILADKAYVGIPSVVSPVKGKREKLSPAERSLNERINQERAVVERSFGRLKEFKALTIPWRAGLERQHMAFYVCLCLTNKKIEESPMFK